MSFQQENKWKKERIGRAVANDSFTIPYNVGWEMRQKCYNDVKKYISDKIMVRVENFTLIRAASQAWGDSVYDKINDYDFTPSKR